MIIKSVSHDEGFLSSEQSYRALSSQDAGRWADLGRYRA